MATKLYLRNDLASYSNLPTTEQSSLTPDANLFTGEVITNNRRMSTVIGTSQANLTNASTADSAAHNYYIGRWVSNQLNQTSVAANTWTLEYAAKASNAAANFPRSGAGAIHVCAYVWKPSNGTKYGNIIDGNSNADGEEAGTTQSVINFTFSGAAVNSLTAGDAVIVVELWAIVTQANTTTRTQDIYYNGTTENSTTNEAAYLSTPETLAFLPDISKSSIVKYNILGRISKAVIKKWNVIGRISLSRIYKYHVLQRVGRYSTWFATSNDYIDCTNDATLWSQSLTKFSFSMWIYPVLGGDGSRRIVQHYGGANAALSAQGFSSSIDATNPALVRFQIQNAANTTIAAESTSLVLNTWNHITCTYDNSLGSANLKIYVNSVVGGTTANLTEAINKSATLILADSTDDFRGFMKDFRWFTTKALSQTEIDNIYANNTSAPTPDYWLKMDEGTGNPVDTISGSKVGTMTNGTTWAAKSPTLFNGVAQILKWNIEQSLERISKSQIYKYHVQARVSLSRIYKSHIQGRVSLSRTYKYHVLGRVSLARTYLYHVLGRITLSRIYKYNIQGRVSLSRIYKHHIASRVSLSNVYKYNILNRVSLSRVYLYNVLSRVSRSRSYLYHVLGRISLSRMYKYHIQSRISLSRTYLYHVANLVSLSRVYKYNIQSRVQLSRTYLYNLLGRVSLSRVYKYNILGRVSLPINLLYSVVGRVSKSSILKYNIHQRISLSGTYLWNLVESLLERVSKPQVYKWNVNARVTVSRVYKYNILDRVSLSRIYLYHLQSRVSLSRSYLYSVIGRISLSRIYKYNLLNRVSLARSYKYHITNLVSKASVFKYNVIARVSLNRIYKYNMIGRISKASTLVYNVANRVSKTSVLKWHLVQRVTQSSVLKYNVISRVSLSRVYRWALGLVTTVRQGSITGDAESRTASRLPFDKFRSYLHRPPKTRGHRQSKYRRG